jgi:copper chaperone CopZ
MVIFVNIKLDTKMKSLLLAVLLGFGMPAVSMANVVNSGYVFLHDGDKEPNTLAFKVEKVIDSEKDAKKLKASIMKVKGVKDVNVCMKSGTVKVSYTDELQSKDDILASVEKAGYKYNLNGGCCSKDAQKKACPASKTSCGDKKTEVQ